MTTGIRSLAPQVGSGRPVLVRAIRDGLSVAGVLLLIVALRTGGLPGYDFYAYWSVDPAHPYVIAEGFGNFHYPPPLVWIAGPLKLLPWPLAYWVWFGILFGVLVWLARDWALAWLAFPPVSSELYHGNIHLLIAAALVVSLRHPPAYAFLALSKVTTGVTAIWWVVRREWRALGIALGTTAVIGAISFVLAADQWITWVSHVAAESNEATILITIPLALRLPIAAALVVVAARVDRPWLLAPAVTLALPLLWIHGLAVLVAITPLWRMRQPTSAAAEAHVPPVVPEAPA
jgi:Glycosyltransferase family 87